MTAIAPGRRQITALVAGLVVTCISFCARADEHDRVAETEWARGFVIDSVLVSGNTRVRDEAILREMQLRAGARFDPEMLERDRRFIEDLSAFATADAAVDSAGAGHCIIRVCVTERSSLVTSLAYPVLEYDFDRQRLRYGVRWNDRNFRKRLESLSSSAIRDNLGRDNVSAGWSTRWVGWTQLGLSVGGSYFHRHDAPIERAIVEQTRVSAGVSIPLVDSRARVVQITGGLGLTNNRLGESGQSSTFETLVSPGVGVRYDSRDSGLRPRKGEALFSGLTLHTVVNDGRGPYFLYTADARLYRAVSPRSVLAMWTRLDYQFGEFPDYIRFGLGGSGTLRGYNRNAFRGSHRWFQTAELRISPWNRWLTRFPIVGVTDFRLAFAVFVDTGIAWRRAASFSSDNAHSGFGAGLRLYSPIQDVLRFDVGMTAHGTAHAYFSSGVRF